MALEPILDNLGVMRRMIIKNEDRPLLPFLLVRQLLLTKPLEVVRRLQYLLQEPEHFLLASPLAYSVEETTVSTA